MSKKTLERWKNTGHSHTRGSGQLEGMSHCGSFFPLFSLFLPPPKQPGVAESQALSESELRLQQLLNLSGPRFPQLYNGNNNAYLTGLL